MDRTVRKESGLNSIFLLKSLVERPLSSEKNIKVQFIQKGGAVLEEERKVHHFYGRSLG